MAGTGIYKNDKELSSKAVKMEIMRIRGWDEAEYTRQRKRLTKQITTFNALMESMDGQFINDTAVQILYKESMARKHFGKKYQPSFRTIALHSMAATSGRSRGEKAINKAREQFTGYVYDRFRGLINNNDGAAELARRIKDPVKLEAALSKYANDMHNAIGNKKKETNAQAIPFSSQSYGSDAYDTDLTAYLSEYLDDDEAPDVTGLEEINPDDIFA